MRIFTFLVLALSFVLSTSDVFAQKDRGYVLGFGVKGGKFSSGATGKYFFGTNNSLALEANFTIKKNFGTGMATFFLEMQKPFFNNLLQIPLDYFVGIGTHTAIYKPGYYRIREGNADFYREYGVSVGFDAKVGLEYTWSKFPLTTSIEACPMVDIINPGPEKVELAIAIRYVLGANAGTGRKFGGNRQW